jgi:uncharacterized integral membrane protein
MRWLRRLVAAAIFVGALVVGWRFAHANANPVFVDYLLGSVDAPVWATLLGAFGIGAVVSGLVFGFQAARLALTTRRYRKLARGLEDEVHQLRNLPLAGPDVVPARSGDPTFEARGRSG